MRRLLWMAACLLLVPLRPSGGQTTEPFRFLHLTDTRLTAQGSLEPLKPLAAEINAMNPRPAFVVETGDITEAGRPEEFARFLEAANGLGLPFHAAPGVHDVRWSPLGKEGFLPFLQALRGGQATGREGQARSNIGQARSNIGQARSNVGQARGPAPTAYESFDYGGCHFVVLDSTMLLGRWGRFDLAQLQWLEGDLKKMKKETPVFVFSHHPIGRAPRVVDNEDALLRVLAPYNVAAMLVGHGNADTQWKVNGIQCVMARGQSRAGGSYHLVEVGAEQIKILRVRKEDAGGAPQTIATIPRVGGPSRRVAFLWDDLNVPVLARRRFLAELRVGKDGAHDEKVTAEYSMDNGALKPMARDTRDKESVSFIAQFETKGLTTGGHRLHIRLTAPDGSAFQREETFAVEEIGGQPKRVWDFPAESPIQGSPAQEGGLLYVASLGGKVYALEAATGKRRWMAAAKGGLLATPVVAEERVYVGAMDHFFYALDAKSGRVQWKFDAGTPLFATAAVSNGVVCFGANRKIYGLDAATGKPRWTQEAGGFFQSRAAAADGVFYLGGWDNTLYALDALTGQPRWKAAMGRANGGRGDLFFYSSPAIASPTVGAGRIYICTNDGLLHAVNARTGQDDWTARAPEGGDPFGHSSPLYANGRIYVGGLGEKGQGDCYALDAQTGTLLWRCPTGADNDTSSPALADGLVVIGSAQGRLSWIDAATGALKWQYHLDPGFCFSTPAVSGKTTYMTAMNGSVYAIALP